jgi:hypothetical protein
MRFPIVLADVLTSVVAVQFIHPKGVCPDSPHLFIDVLAKVGYVENPTSTVQVGIHQVSLKAFKHG